MNLRRLLLLLPFIAMSASAEPKAYELVRYKGKIDGLVIALDYGDGYPQASEVRVTDLTRKNTTRFLLDDSGKMQFLPEKHKAGLQMIVLKLDLEDGAPEKVDAFYRAKNRTVSFSLRKQ